MFLVFNCCVHMMIYLCFEIIDAFFIGFAFVRDSALGSFLTSKIPPHYSFLKWAKSSCGRFCAAPPRKSCQSSTSVRSPSPLGRNMNNYARFSIWLVAGLYGWDGFKAGRWKKVISRHATSQCKIKPQPQVDRHSSTWKGNFKSVSINIQHGMLQRSASKSTILPRCYLA